MPERLIKNFAAATGLLVLLAALCLAGCAASRPAAPAAPDREIAWPAPAASPRIEWLGAFRGAEDLGLNKGLWSRMRSFMTGEELPFLVRPYGIDAQADAPLFIADTGGARVHLIDLQRRRHEVVAGSEELLFRSPIDLARDGRGHLYITDSALGAILRYDRKKEVLTRFAATGLKRPTGIAYAPQQALLYVADAQAHQVVAFDLNGAERRRFGMRGSAAGQFNFPTALSVAGNGDLLVTDALNFRIQRFAADGRFLSAFGQAGDALGHFSRPKGVALDSAGNVYVCDAELDTVQIFNDSGQLLLNFGTKGNGPGQFLMPTGIFIDERDTIYVADSYNQRIQIFRFIDHDRTPIEK
ncbi:MAG: 6-bladed beta-propeller [Desulfuromonas sp.]|uniref:SMP-30/gluconolactonase/LRE family protein n=1 Tax=Desulfuromonas sp. TaxID=892 RepID=UPI000CC56D4C|nr:SMP-30/gluconolactonase/LRE family protein [Desulfuromonas sp.]PLX86527.1 MAG: 6-bladed beta-propeller [Desulfuromonas sp.]